MVHDYITELPEPAFPREQLDAILLSATIVSTALPTYYLGDNRSVVGYLYLVDPEHRSHDGSDLQPIFCSLVYDSIHQLYLVAPHGLACSDMSEAARLYESLCSEHRDGAA